MRLDDLATLNAERAARRPVVTVTDLGDGGQRVVYGAALDDDPLAALLADHIRLGRSGTVDHEGRLLFLNVHVPPVRLVAVGAVHISQALAPMARLAGLHMIVVDPRTAFASAERFPDIELLPDWPDDVLPRLAIDRYTAVALLTHDPRIDDQALIAALKSPCFYLGALGSRKTHARRLERMRAMGFGDGDFARIHAPIGLDIGAVSPAEIAVSILGEVVAALRHKPKRAEMHAERPGQAA